MTKKNTIEKAVNIIPSVLEKITEYLKDSKNHFLQSVASGNSTLAFLLKIFGQPLIDRVNEKVQSNKLSEFGLGVYLKASVLQLQHALEKLYPTLENTYSIDGITSGFEATIRDKELKSKKMDWILFFQPKYHPIVKEVFELADTFLKALKVDNAVISQLRKYYFEGIEEQIVTCFGKESYAKHINEVKKYYFLENETQLLLDNINLARIGFKENEDLQYETTFAEWKSVSSLLTYEKNQKKLNLKEIEESESELNPIESLIETYFAFGKGSHLDKILFLIADFGKGKSVFLKNYCAKSSRKYIENPTEYFPIYFNLRRFKDYDNDHHLGVIANYLEKEYNIKISNDYFINRRYLFLIDSLDECGELTATNVNKVIESIKKIQNLDPEKYKYNRLIITSRPFDDGLKPHLHRHSPYIQKNIQQRDVDYYISVYGFKKEQFNHWLQGCIERLPGVETIEADGINKKIIQSIINKKKIDIYKEFYERNIISYGELRRPIFAYMLFQLISNSISFDKTGRIGIYLSFLNLLTKEAKYVHDNDLTINLREQFEARNILHTTAAVWLYNRTSTNKSEIKKADICRAMQGKVIDTDDNLVLQKHANNQSDIRFLSHSYFGENDNLIHFQHQSFAEILVAEYLLKVILKFALDREFDYDEARVRLSLGEPTDQTIVFLKELIVLFRDSINEFGNYLEIRKLTFPLLASLATIKNNTTTYSNSLALQWYEKIDFPENVTELPQDALTNWPINDETVNRISLLCKKIIESDNLIAIAKGENCSALFNHEVYVTKNQFPTLNIDKWIALVCGNLMYNNLADDKWFNSTFYSFDAIYKMIKQSNAFIPIWAKDFFIGIKIDNRNEFYDLSHLNLSGCNFSNSNLNNISFRSSTLINANFSNSILNFVQFDFSIITYCNFDNTKILNYQLFALSTIDQGCLFPYSLAYKGYKSQNRNYDKEEFDNLDLELEFHGILTNNGDPRLSIFHHYDIRKLAGSLGRILQYGFRHNLWSEEEIIDAFNFDNDTTKKVFIEEIFDNMR